MSWLRAGRPELAADAFDSAARFEPDSASRAKWRNLSARAKRVLHTDPSESRALFEEIAVASLYESGLELLRFGKVTEALVLAERTVRQWPARPEGYLMLAEVVRGRHEGVARTLEALADSLKARRTPPAPTSKP